MTFIVTFEKIIPFYTFYLSDVQYKTGYTA